MRRVIALFVAAFPLTAADVAITETTAAFTLSNGYLTAQVDKNTCDLTSLKFRGLELMDHRTSAVGSP